MKTVLLNQQVIAILTSVGIPEKLSSLSAMIDDESLAGIDIAIESTYPMYYVASDELIFIPIASVFNSCKTMFKPILIEAEVYDIDAKNVSNRICSDNTIILGKSGNFRIRNLKYISKDDMYEYFYSAMAYLSKEENSVDKGLYIKSVLDAFSFYAVANNDLFTLKTIVDKYNYSLVQDAVSNSVKNYELLMLAFGNLNREMIDFILQNSFLRANSDAIKLFITKNPCRKLKDLIKLYHSVTGDRITINDFKGFNKLKYIRSLL